MTLKQLYFLILALLFISFNANAQENADKILKDTIAYSDKNTQKVIEFGSFIENTIHSSDVDSFLLKLNEDLFFERVLSHHPDIDASDSYIKGFLVGMKQSLNSFPQEIMSQVENGSYYDFISYRYDVPSQTYYALFRMYSVDSGMNYHDFRLHKTNDDIQFTDMYTYLTGEHFTQTLGRMITYTLPEKKSKKKRTSDLNKDFKEVFKALMYNNNEKYNQAYNTIDGLKTELSKEKFLQIFKVLVASNIDESKYLKALEELIETHPDDPTIALNKIDYHYYKGEYYEAIQVINQLQNETEDDFLNYMKASVAFEDENYDLALNLFKYTIDNYPDFFDGQAGYLNTLVMLNNFTDAVIYLDALITDGYDKPLIIDYVEEEDENGENILDKFAKSEDFKAWKNK
ncbi:hypothetical protein SAMN04515667_1482 [Formosa sp. Hel1_31_208]|uniref:tetratricopeptide repeat protein n=1 Tax=Formosa sp. Hel1_31_208 TaxID=1798225 RepID=UPI000879E145|nr:tetratricopeptide repeat protein [Formosa sp. Hel1_31_208]SDS13182.1 hypothetical protein SAMN04515667_1482 [Formosa sp. Hel1_31_208]